VHKIAFYAQILTYLIVHLLFDICLIDVKSNSLKMIKTDRNMSELRHIECTKCNFNISADVGCIVCII
jgi:hypothetical protein